MPTWFRHIFALTALLMLPVVLHAQTKETSDAPQQGIILKRLLEQRVEKVLGRHLPEKDFSVVITPKMKVGTTKKLPYAPAHGDFALTDSIATADLLALTSQVKIEVYLSAAYSKAHQQKIRTILFEKMGLTKLRGDEVAFVGLGLDLPDQEEQKAITKLRKSQSELDALKSNSEQTKKERDDLKQELLILKNAPRDQKGEVLPGPTKKELVIYAGWFLVAVAALVVIFISATMFSRALRKSGDGVQAVAEAIAQFAQVSAKPNAVDPGSPAQLGKGEGIKLIESAAGGKAATGSRVPTAAIDTLQARLLQLHEEITKNIDDVKGNAANLESIVVQHLSTMLEQKENVPKAVVTMELLGRDRANKLFTRLPQSAQELIMAFLKQGFYQVPKAELMLEAGEELKTKLLADQFGSVRFITTERVTELLLQMTGSDLLDVCKKLDERSIPRFLLYLNTEKIVQLLRDAKDAEPAHYHKMTTLITRMPDFEQSTQLDEIIIAAIQARMATNKEDRQRPYLKIYQSVIEAADDEMAEELTSSLTSRSKAVGQYLEKNTVLISMLFKLPVEVIEANIFDALGNRDLAALINGFDGNKKQFLLSHLEQRRRDQVNEEVERAASRTKRQNSEDHKAAKQTVLGILRKLKTEGTLDELMAGAAGAPQNDSKEKDADTKTEQNAAGGKGVIDPAA